MILSDKTIREYLSCGRLSIDPIEPGQIQPASVDIRIGDTYSIVEESCDGIIRLGSEIRYKTIQSERYLLMPGQFVLATTMEYFRLGDDLTAFVEGRSSIGRLGLFIQNAGWVDPGFEGEITLGRCTMQAGVRSSWRRAAESVSWYLPSWTGVQKIHTGENIRGSEEPQVRAFIWMKKFEDGRGYLCRFAAY